MAQDDDTRSSKPPTESEGGSPASALDPVGGTDAKASPSIEGVEREQDEVVASELGAQRYVHTAFFVAAILAAYLCGQILLGIWNTLADWPAAVRAVPQLIQYAEEERSTTTMIVGAVLGFLLVLRYYRKPETRAWANDVAVELSRVTWPNKEMVTNGTIVVLVAGAVGTLYVAILDRFWGYLTTLVYGA